MALAAARDRIIASVVASDIVDDILEHMLEVGTASLHTFYPVLSLSSVISKGRGGGSLLVKQLPVMTSGDVTIHIQKKQRILF